MKIVIGKHGAKNVSLDIERLLATRLLIQANSGKGKSWLIRLLAEQLFGKIPVIILDPEGEFATLREKYGYVLVGKGGETPADTRSAAMVAHKLLQLKASAVCDLYEMKPSQRHMWVAAFLDALIDAPKELWHPVIVIVDEAHVFCPEKGAGESEASEAMISLATRGRKRGFCAVFATQRLGKLRKDAAAELVNVLIGGTFIDVDRKRAADTLGVYGKDTHKFFDAVKLLERGQFFALGPAISQERILVKVGDVETTHPEAGSAKHADGPPPAPEAIAKMLPKLADLPKQAEEQAKTVAEFKSEIRSLKAQLRAQPAGKPVEVKVADPRAVEKAVRLLKAEADKQIAERDRAIGQLAKGVKQATDILRAAAERALKMKLPPMKMPEMPKPSTQIKAPDAFRALKESAVRRPTVIPADENSNGHLAKGEMEVLKAIAKFSEGVERHQVTVLTGYKRSTRDAYLARLMPKGYIAEQGGRIFATEEGIASLGENYESVPPSGDELQRYWLDRLPDGERKLLQLLLEANGQDVEREFLTENSGYKRSTRDAYLARMMAKHIIEADRGKVKAVEQFFM